MAIKSRNKTEVSFNSSSMSDLVFLLLIFFMLTSTLVAPNAIKLMLPSSTSKTMAKQTVTVYIDKDNRYYVHDDKSDIYNNEVKKSELKSKIQTKIGNTQEATIVLRADKTVPVQYIVDVIDAVNEINASTNQKHKVILATKADKK